MGMPLTQTVWIKRKQNCHEMKIFRLRCTKSAAKESFQLNWNCWRERPPILLKCGIKTLQEFCVRFFDEECFQLENLRWIKLNKIYLDRSILSGIPIINTQHKLLHILWFWWNADEIFDESIFGRKLKFYRFIRILLSFYHHSCLMLTLLNCFSS